MHRPTDRGPQGSQCLFGAVIFPRSSPTGYPSSIHHPWTIHQHHPLAHRHPQLPRHQQRPTPLSLRPHC
ncbi:hypothetical protein BDP81DRAFT_425992 [Colletotrichum phormii]|uniref:Uncharacterized protein n=1 Tax=Colletotrichum phormii TaxID=359342 RepID=A0AAJ0EGA9_9PEZI|nr:uncharacterized protein BDP81DRAFT_425992 [Colletotrichum phormii]KAK1637824.1 hypothetical protein BDP81DRAFT_425992 [Colletotrichum phormii]